MMAGKTKLRVLNLEVARFECVYPSCGGPCCKNSRPPCTDAEAERIDTVMSRALPLLRPAARAIVERRGFRTQRKKEGIRMLGVVDQHCLFYADDGCALHHLGLEEGDAYMYKPWVCSTFPLDRDGKGGWYVRQHGTMDEGWDLFCLSPTESDVPAETSLRSEL